MLLAGFKRDYMESMEVEVSVYSIQYRVYSIYMKNRILKVKKLLGQSMLCFPLRKQKKLYMIITIIDWDWEETWLWVSLLDSFIGPRMV